MRAIKRVARVGQSAVIVALLASLLASGVQAKAWGNDREPDWNDAQCDDDEGTGNDWKCEGTSK